MKCYRQFLTPLVIVSLGLLFSSIARANMVVYPMEVRLDKKGVAQVQVISKSDVNQFVKINVKKIIDPGMPSEHEVDADEWQEGGLVVTPRKLVLTPGAKRVVRLITLEPPSKETTWRVFFEGVPAPKENEPSIESGSKKITPEVGLSLVWGVLVHVPPKDPKVELTLDKSNGKISNHGTVSVSLRELGVCKSVTKCSWSKNTSTIYPDGNKSFEFFKNKNDQLFKIRYYDWINQVVVEKTLSVVH